MLYECRIQFENLQILWGLIYAFIHDNNNKWSSRLEICETEAQILSYSSNKPTIISH